MHVWVLSYKEIIMATVNKDFRVKHGLIVEGTNATVNGSDIITEDAITGGTQTNIAVTYNAETKVVNFVAENGVADSNTDALAEGTTNLYFTDERAQDAIGNAVGTGLTYNDTSGAISVTTNTYDAYGSASAVAGDLTTHTSATEAHGATGAVVGTTNTQTLTNKTLTSPKINEDVVLTATATELNVLDGITATTAELNTLDGITATVSELNILDGVTSTAAELNILDGVTSTAAELNILDGATLTVTELNYVDGVTSAIQTQLDGKLDESGGTMTGALAMGTNKITGLGTPTDATDAATKAYVDSAVQGIDWKASVRAATTTAVTLASDLENGDTLDGVTLATGNRILVKNQSTGSENGIYVVQATGAPTRSTDADTDAELTSNFAVFVEEGTLNADQGYVLTNDGAITVGTTALVFTQFTGLGQVTAGTGLEKTGNTINIDSTVTTLTGTQTLTNKTLTSPKINEDVVLTATATELNILDGATLTTVELNYVDGVTSAIQTQLDAKATPADITTAVDAITTTVIEEGTNLYFTDVRAVDALEAVVPNFTAVEVNSLAKQVAATVSAPTAASQVVAYAFAKADYRSAKFLVKVAYSTHTEISEVLLTLDSSDNIAITEFAVVSTNGSTSAISAGISGSNVQLLVTPVNNSSTVTVVGTLLA
jgi:hypothetical protein